MQEFTKPQTAPSFAYPLQAHLAHLRHLSRSGVMSSVLQQRFSFTKPDARDAAPLISGYISRALEFHQASRHASSNVCSVLQYYAYLNFATGVVLAYRPPNHASYQNHGATDLTKKHSSLDLRSKVIEIGRKGTIPLFHSILSDRRIENLKFRLKDIVACLPSVGFELEEILGTPMIYLYASARLAPLGGAPMFL
jgi:hypothetical protein